MASRPPPPKKPLTSYFIYVGENRATVKSEFPALKHTEIQSKLTEKWNALTDEEKTPYVEKQKELKAEYERAIAEYTTQYPNWREEEKAIRLAAKEAKAVKAAKKATGAIQKRGKKGKTSKKQVEQISGFVGFTLFQFAMRRKIMDETGIELLANEGNAKISRLWNELSTEEKTKWQEKSRLVNKAQEEEAAREAKAKSDAEAAAEGEQEEEANPAGEEDVPMAGTDETLNEEEEEEDMELGSPTGEFAKEDDDEAE
ncbi:HMG (high mobility group) box [Carpediemonas membranifera]|uniref:HMG (High mobility group) box n=1 Tax=Carpediemonas membranifera TaxID=201153 RepID=A0A8J6B7Y1_9EUKA|nr:HMG (high mobility group) box [Carpediemonas membranifera]|eukprot:KAG9391887.1 HMG (high mobility group) box [Carpediemonas membranifera]